MPYYFSETALNQCDFIFKRNFERKYISPLGKTFQEKIKPFGLIFPTRSRNAQWDFYFLLALILMNIGMLNFDRFFFPKSIRYFKKYLNQWINTRKSRQLECFNNFSEATESLVIYQTRCFSRIEDPDVLRLNNQRTELIRKCRESLGNKFIGGYIPDIFSSKHFPDCISSIPSDPFLYLESLQKASIAIYTRGLRNSPAWKMAEYLSQGKCIVAEHLTAELPVPLEHEKHLMYFSSSDECIEICRSLLTNPAKRTALSYNARQYYEQNVEPSVNMKRILNFMTQA